MAEIVLQAITIQWVAKQLRVPERTVRERAQAIGACRKIGNTVFMLQADLDHFLEDLRWQQDASNSTGAAKSGTIAGLSLAADYAELVKHRKRQLPKGRPRKSKTAPGKVISMARRRN